MSSFFFNSVKVLTENVWKSSCLATIGNFIYSLCQVGPTKPSNMWVEPNAYAVVWISEYTVFDYLFRKCLGPRKTGVCCENVFGWKVILCVHPAKVCQLLLIFVDISFMPIGFSRWYPTFWGIGNRKSKTTENVEGMRHYFWQSL